MLFRSACEVHRVIHAADAVLRQHHALVAHSDLVVVITTADVEQILAGIVGPGGHAVNGLTKSRLYPQATHRVVDAHRVMVDDWFCRDRNAAEQEYRCQQSCGTLEPP